MWPNLHFLADLVTLTEETLSGKLHFLCNNFSQSRLWLTSETCHYPNKKTILKVNNRNTERKENNMFKVRNKDTIKTSLRFLLLSLNGEMFSGMKGLPSMWWMKVSLRKEKILLKDENLKPNTPSRKVSFIFFNESPLEVIKYAFYFTLKVIFILKIFKFLSSLFCSCRKTAW